MQEIKYPEANPVTCHVYIRFLRKRKEIGKLRIERETRLLTEFILNLLPVLEKDFA
jgi:hypothetical protein